MSNVISFLKEKAKRRPSEPFYTRARAVMSPEKAMELIRAGTYPGAVFRCDIITGEQSATEPASVA